MSDPSLVRNPWSLAGAWLTTVSAVAFVAYYAAEEFGLLASPYSGLLGFVVVPALFLAGLLLIPFGIWREARRRRRGSPAWHWPAIDLGNASTRRVIVAVAFLTVVNLALIAVAGLGATHYMETQQFCGQVCHVPMRPEFTAHKVSPHAHVSCVACHVSPGAAGTVRAKMNGTRQFVLLASGDFARPIPVPARGLPVAADTCERCHSLARMPGEVTRTTYSYADDQANTESTTSMVVQTGRIHWHARPDVRVEYVATDHARETIPYVKVTGADGVYDRIFRAGRDRETAGDLRRMDCLDCHTRPAHTFSTSAEQAVDRAIAAGEIDRGLPFVQPRDGRRVEGRLPGRACGGRRRFSRRLDRLLQGCGCLAGVVGCPQYRRRRAPVPDERVSRNERVLGHVQEPARPHRTPRLRALSRRPAQSDATDGSSARTASSVTACNS